ncbi:hypothetical protein GCM10010873_36510 [Cypionkella aquatica]|uniref:Rhamnan synthesis protein F n=2 Tax=Cypionkella aquatica TaxID=1756042 RepID=A0AA37U0L8_9RHOB|nr:hypothetical protein GCM10010873_35870 [Cypionkella aquatica]GLS88677.1 hypothetical protein GCM10010873_36510 [Cypionkella aquatica]
MRALGFANNRIFDALACGARVLSDDVEIPAELQPYVTTSSTGILHKDALEALSLAPPIVGEELEILRSILQNEYSFDAAARKIIGKVADLATNGIVFQAPFDKLRAHPLTMPATKWSINTCDDPDLFDLLSKNVDKNTIWTPGSPIPNDTVLVAPKHLMVATDAMPERSISFLLAPVNRHNKLDAEKMSIDLAVHIRRLSTLAMVCADVGILGRFRFIKIDEIDPSQDSANPLCSIARDIYSTWDKSPIDNMTFSLTSLQDSLSKNKPVATEIVLPQINDAIIRFSPDASSEPLDKLLSRISSDTPERQYEELANNIFYQSQINTNFVLKEMNVRRLDSEGQGNSAKVEAISFQSRLSAPKPTNPVGVFIHLFYLDGIDAIKDILLRINAPMHIYISTDCDIKRELIKEKFENFQTDIRVFKNRGRDIYPKLFGWIPEHQHHELVLHLHGKKSDHIRPLAQSWFDDITECLAPDEGTVNSIIAMFKNIKGLGMIGPRPFQQIANNIHWRNNHNIGREILRRIGMASNIADLPLQFPAGSMFWARPSALAPLFKLALDADDFPPEQGQLDGTLAHALERCLALSCEFAGLRYLEVAPGTEGREKMDVGAVRALLKAN